MSNKILLSVVDYKLNTELTILLGLQRSGYVLCLHLKKNICDKLLMYV